LKTFVTKDKTDCAVVWLALQIVETIFSGTQKQKDLLSSCLVFQALICVV